jgi:hypothetical protein
VLVVDPGAIVTADRDRTGSGSFRFAAAAGLLVALVASACNETHVCPAVAVVGLIVTVDDAATGAPVCDATVTATDGAYSETLSAFTAGACTYQGARERAGTYSITAVQGSRTATVDGVTVVSDGCNVVTRQVTITLGP